MKYILSHLDTCVSDYFRGSHLPVVQVEVGGTTTYRDIRDSLCEYNTYEQYYHYDYKIKEFDEEVYRQGVHDLFANIELDVVPDSFYGLPTFDDLDYEDVMPCYMYFTIEVDFSEELEAIERLRKNGYAVVYFEPEELKGIDKELLEDRICEEACTQISEYNSENN